MQKRTNALHRRSAPAGLTVLPWKKALLASAASLAMLGVSLDAQALALGAVTVRSALGEPLRAEIEVPQISSEEAASFQAGIASPQAFRAAGVDYSPALTGARLSLQRRPNGQAYLRLVSDRPINEPFLGVVVEANWATGRLVRDYTMLVDPPGRPVASAPVPPPSASIAPQPGVVSTPTAEQVTRSETSPRPSRTPRATEASQPRGASANRNGQVTVQRGDTAYKIASSNLPDGVSLDQMLIAMMRANPNAFIRGNVNLMKAGAVLDLPSAEQANSISRTEARRAVATHSRDFQEFRRSLAQSAPRTQVAAAGRSASGRVAASVQEGTSAPPTPDRLTISKGTVDSTAAPSAAETGLAQSRQAQEQAERIAELNRNIDELARLKAPASTASAPDAPAIGLPTGAIQGASAAPGAATPPTVANGAQAGASSAAAMGATEAPAASPAPAPVAKPAPMEAPEPSFLDSLKENPLLPVAGAGLLALLAAYGVYRSRQKKQADLLNDSLGDSRVSADSFFGASGGKRVDTSESSERAGAPSSMMYSPSQIDSAGDVDPVAEAEVYLAYGRDTEAEKILKEALRVYPGRVSIQRKLAEIYAKRRDSRALEAVATAIRTASGGAGPDWEHVRELGEQLDPANKLYAPGAISRKPSPNLAPARPDFDVDTLQEEPSISTRMGDETRPPSMAPGLDLSLDDASVKSEPSAHASNTVVAPMMAAAAATAAATSTIGKPPAATKPPADAPSATELAPLDFDLSLSELDAPDTVSPATPSPTPLTPTTQAAKPAALDLPKVSSGQSDSGMIEFDLEALSVDPETRTADLLSAQPDEADDDPLSTKLELAREFHAIGDTEGALSLAKEVVSEADGPIKARAERFLSELS
ncbi:hypothetical protein K3217_27530 [bacterium BD-1]|nr:hypothetical protein [Ottowia caeni]